MVHAVHLNIDRLLAWSASLNPTESTINTEWSKSPLIHFDVTIHCTILKIYIDRNCNLKRLSPFLQRRQKVQNFGQKVFQKAVWCINLEYLETNCKKAYSSHFLHWRRTKVHTTLHTFYSKHYMVQFALLEILTQRAILGNCHFNQPQSLTARYLYCFSVKQTFF